MHMIVMMTILMTEYQLPVSVPTQVFRSLMRIMIICMVILAVGLVGLGVYVIQLHVQFCLVRDQVERLETQCNPSKTHLSSDVEDRDLSAQIFNLNMEVEKIKHDISTLRNIIQTVQATQENDMDLIQVNISTILMKINTSLTTLVMSFTNEAASNITELKREVSNARNYSLILGKNVSALTHQVLLLEKRSDEFEMNIQLPWKAASMSNYQD